MPAMACRRPRMTMITRITHTIPATPRPAARVRSRTESVWSPRPSTPPSQPPSTPRSVVTESQLRRRFGTASAWIHPKPSPLPSDTAAALVGDVRGEEAQRHHRGDLPRGAEPDQHRAEHPGTAHADLHAGED